MLERSCILHRLVILFLLIILSVALPLPARADGGPIVGPHLWASLKEGRQIAVVTLKDTNSADVDLFISLLDSTGESHEVVFFLPLGFDADDFGVFEESSLDFDKRNTEELDRILYKDVQRRQQSINSLFAGTLLINGVWLLPLWVPMLLSGCAEAMPEATFETESSQVSIFGLDEDTDLDDLINTTGLDPSVQGSLSRLRGQRIAVVNLQTQPQGAGGDDSDEHSRDSEPGIHLSWTSALVSGESGAAYSYPLGTGDSWSHPIEITRIYVVAPPGIDFSVQYPELGVECSGYDREFGGYSPRIADYQSIPAYAIDEAIGNFGRVWRATYTQSNSAEDIVIVASPQSWLSKTYAGAQVAGEGWWAFLLGLIAALFFWIMGWRHLVPYLLGDNYQGNIATLQRCALTYTYTNFGLLFPGVILYWFWSATGSNIFFVPLLILFGGVSTLIFSLGHLKRLGTDTRKAVKAYVVVTLASNGAYLLFSLLYAKLTGII
jgi:hypothetical protein